jgi:hypothetical protein
MAKKIWIVYKTESMSAPGWEERQLIHLIGKRYNKASLSIRC